jgi:outer membrane protein TolC
MNWAAGMQIILPALDFFSLRAQKKVQEANVRAEQARYEQTLDDLSVAVQQAQAELEGAREAAQNTPIELTAAQQSEQQQRARFQSGLATVVDVTAAETLLVQAEADDAVARINVWRALAQLAAAQGDLSPFLAQLQRQP